MFSSKCLEMSHDECSYLTKVMMAVVCVRKVAQRLSLTFSWKQELGHFPISKCTELTVKLDLHTP